MTENDEASYATQVRQARLFHGWTQEQLAAQMAERGHDWRQNTVSKVENGTRRPWLAEGVDLAELLDLTWASTRDRVPR